MKQILLLGAGYVAGPCLDYLLRREDNHVTVGQFHTRNCSANSANSQCQ